MSNDKWKILTEVSEILKSVGGGRHSRATQAGDDYDVRDAAPVIFHLSFSIFYLSSFQTLSCLLQMENEKCQTTNGKYSRLNQPVVSVLALIKNSQPLSVGIAKH